MTDARNTSAPAATWIPVSMLACVVLFLALLVMTSTWGLPRVVSCIHEDDRSPAVAMELSSTRQGGEIVERPFLGCSVYFHEGRGGVD